MPGSTNLGAKLEHYVTGLVESGRYPSRSDVLREGVRLIEEREKRLATLDAAIVRGLADAEADRVKSISDVAARLTGKYRALPESDEA
ncbi:type II toxin-antitoxin system ParD family antitoxin [Methylobacterium sp. J-078]|uniref:type II toxin-antitoxin system ParD family antitoxin n=1 Tax=Methylobacterium sp. J-078 TaxID=2836657 RepID=UPI001FB91957|nr:type II toxin-antitoxin system ParD family antitoxin [Methylobacterium sp. J-078]MCJ2045518.1 type II toxin-antitoxin system ParD family antitoxin [Methylobacterium sp. J-078]